MDILAQWLSLPGGCYLGKRVFKKMFMDHGKLTAADKRALREEVDTITWEYTLKPQTIPVAAYTDEFREYLEIAVLRIELKAARSVKRLAEVIHRTIPYPLLLAFFTSQEGTAEGGNSGQVAFSVAPKRFSQAEKGAIVAEEVFLTPWIELDGLKHIEQQFLESLASGSQPHTHFFAFYQGWIDRFLALESGRLNGRFAIVSSDEYRRLRLDTLDRCHALEDQLAALLVEAKKARQLNQRVDVNTKIKEMRRRLAAESAKL